MSGLKKGHFDQAVGRLKENMERYLELSRNSAERFLGGDTENVMSSIQSIHRRLDAIPASELELAREESIQLANEIQELRQQLQDIEKQFIQTDTQKQEASALQKKTAEEIADIARKLEVLSQKAQRKIDKTDYNHLSLNKEVSAVNALSAQLRTSIRKVVDDFAITHDAQVIISARLLSMKTACIRLAQKRTQLEAMAARRRESIQIQEKQKQISVQNHEEIMMMVDNIKTLEYDRFMHGRFIEFQSRIQDFLNAFNRDNYEWCAENSPRLLEELKRFFNEMATLVRTFHETEQITRSQLKAAQDELASIDLNDLKRWSQKADEIKNAVERLNTCEVEVERISESGTHPQDFDAPRQTIAAVIDSLRKLMAEATENHARYDARDGIRKAIRDTLKALKYDTPRYYFQENLEDGSPNELSPLTIYAHNPAETGNLRLTVSLEGDTSLEVYREDENGQALEVTQKDAVNCHHALLDFSRQLETSGFNLRITDWGRAKDLTEPTEQHDVAWNDSKPERQIGSEHVISDKTKEIMKERRREQL